MKKVSLDIWIQLLGMIGVLGGLVFVGLELQQSQRIAIASQIQARNDAIMAFFRLLWKEAPWQWNCSRMV